MVPQRINDSRCVELTVKDLDQLQVEEVMQNDIDMPIFYCYYCTSGGDILGQLMFTNDEIIFDPLNSNLKGYYDYESGKIQDNMQMGFIINYNDIRGNPTILKTPNMNIPPVNDSDDVDINYNIQIDLFNTGY